MPAIQYNSSFNKNVVCKTTCRDLFIRSKRQTNQQSNDLYKSSESGKRNVINIKCSFVGSMEALSKAFLLFFLLSDCLKLNHLKSRMECGFSDNFSRHICSTIADTKGVTNYAAILARENVQKTTFEDAEMKLLYSCVSKLRTIFWDTQYLCKFV